MTEAWRWSRPLLILAALVVFGAALGNRFVNFDDQTVLLGQPFLRSLTPTNLLRCFSPFDVREEWLPLRDLTYMLNFALFGPRPGAFVLVNLLLHAGVVLLVHRLGLRVMTLLEAPRPRLLAFLGALTFAVHPIHLESVVWISGRKDSLCALFYLLAVDAYLDHLQGGRGLARAWGWAVCALLSKASAISLPLVLGAAEVLLAPRDRPWRARGLALAPFALASAAFVVGYSAMLRRWGALVGKAVVKQMPEDALRLVALTDASVVRQYLQRLVAPVDLQVFARETYRHSLTLEVALSAVVCLGALAGAVWLARRRPAAGFLALWFFLALVPFLNLAPTGILYAERYLHLPSVGACLLLPWGLWRASEAVGLAPRRALACALTPLLALYALQASRLSRVFRDGGALWGYVSATQPENPRALAALGSHYSSLDPNHPGVVHDLARAEAAYRAAVRLEPRIASAHQHLASVLARRGDLEGALASIGSALALAPHDHEARLTEANLLARLGRTDEALERYDLLLRSRPEGGARAAFNRALALELAGRRAEARAAWAAYLDAYGGRPEEAGQAAEARRRLLRLR